jgi:hypothetical protein
MKMHPGTPFDENTKMYEKCPSIRYNNRFTMEELELYMFYLSF